MMVSAGPDLVSTVMASSSLAPVSPVMESSNLVPVSPVMVSLLPVRIFVVMASSVLSMDPAARSETIASIPSVSNRLIASSMRILPNQSA